MTTSKFPAHQILKELKDKLILTRQNFTTISGLVLADSMEEFEFLVKELQIQDKANDIMCRDLVELKAKLAAPQSTDNIGELVLKIENFKKRYAEYTGALSRCSGWAFKRDHDNGEISRESAITGSKSDIKTYEYWHGVILPIAYNLISDLANALPSPPEQESKP